MKRKIIKLTKIPKDNKVVKLSFAPNSYVYYYEDGNKIFDFDEINGYTQFTISDMIIKIIDRIVTIQTINKESINKEIKFKILVFGD